jgi:tetratricopeptide (TPR) repeat protein
VNRFLGYFGLPREAEALLAQTQTAAGEPGSEAWVLAQFNRGDQLFNAGRVAEAAAVFRAVLATLGDAPGYKRATTLFWLGRCFRDGCRPDLAAQHQRAVLAVLEHLEPTGNVKQLRAGCLTDLADALVDQGHYAEARQAYADGLKVAEEQGDLRGQGVILAQLGTLALKEGNLDEAAERYRAALALFQQLREPEMEAGAWHQLGMVFEKAQRWDKAERHYRESARIEEQQGNLAGAARTWNSLAGVSVRADKLAAAEQWCRKAIEGFKSVGDKETASGCLSNLAGLLRNLPGRLTEARQLAEEALAIQQSLDPGTVAIWNTYHVFAKITEQEAATAVDSRLKAEYQTQACD